MTDQKLRMLVAMDLDQHGEIVLAGALRFASMLNAVVDVVHVAPADPNDFVSYSAGPESVRDSVAKELQERHRRVLGLANKITAAGVTAGQTLTIQGELLRAIPAEVGRLKPDLLVMGQSHHQHFLETLFRSPAERTIEQVNCVTMIIPTP